MSVNVEAAINRIFQEYKTELMKQLDAAPSVARAYAMEVPSSSKSTMHAWLTRQARVREWLGKRVLNEFGTRHWEVFNRDWEISFSFMVNQIRDDLSGLVASAIQAARSDASAWTRHMDLLCAQTLEAGTSTNCYDDQYFFDTDHPVNPDDSSAGTYSNIVAAALSLTSVYTALKRVAGFKNYDGTPLVPPGTKPILMFSGAAHMDTVDTILNTKNLTPAAAYALFGTSGPSENPLYGRLVPVQNDYLTVDGTPANSAAYVVFEVDGIKPIMFQRRQGVETTEQGTDSALYFEEKKVAIGHDARYEATYAEPRLCIQIKP